jgi:hypothetical protein
MVLNYAAEVILVFVIVAIFAITCAGSVYGLRDYLIGRGKSGVPLFLPWVAAVWTGIVVIGTFVWRSFSAKSNSLSISSTNWFTAGWQHGLEFFGIPIDRWWKYSIILCYQTGRSILGSLLSNVFKPFLLSEVQNQLLNSNIDASLTTRILLAQGFVTLFGYVSSLTDLFLFLAQLDMSVITVALTLTTDATSTYLILDRAQKPNTTKEKKRALKELGKTLVEREKDTESLVTRTSAKAVPSLGIYKVLQI